MDSEFLWRDAGGALKWLKSAKDTGLRQFQPYTNGNDSLVRRTEQIRWKINLSDSNITEETSFSSFSRPSRQSSVRVSLLGIAFSRSLSLFYDIGDIARRCHNDIGSLRLPSLSLNERSASGLDFFGEQKKRRPGSRIEFFTTTSSH